MKNPTNVLIGVFAAFIVGLVVGLSGAGTTFQQSIKLLQAEKNKQQHTIDSLNKVTISLKSDLSKANEVTTKETKKYYAIKPNNNSDAYLDSMFRARFK